VTQCCSHKRDKRKIQFSFDFESQDHVFYACPIRNCGNFQLMDNSLQVLAHLFISHYRDVPIYEFLGISHDHLHALVSLMSTNVMEKFDQVLAVEVAVASCIGLSQHPMVNSAVINDFYGGFLVSQPMRFRDVKKMKTANPDLSYHMSAREAVPSLTIFNPDPTETKPNYINDLLA
jgi:hypothetical protein